MADYPKCKVCGETDPRPAWFCLARLAGVAKAGEPCSYSREGSARLTARLTAKQEAAPSAE